MTLDGWEIFKLATDAFLVVAVPSIIAILRALHGSNVNRFDELREQIDHLDGCIDRMRMAAVEVARAASVDHQGLVRRQELLDISNRIGRIEAILLRGPS